MKIDLNEQQKKAVESTEGPCLVLAGAGSGKTIVITKKVKHLIEDKGIQPERILSITFTNKAAAEMKERIEGMVKDNLGEKTEVSTFHSFALKTLRERAGEIPNRESDFKVYAPEDKESILKNIIKNKGMQHTRASEKRYVSLPKVVKYISDLKNDLFRAEDVNNESSNYEFHNWDKLKKIQEKMQKEEIELYNEIYSEYEAQMQANNALDFDDLIMTLVFLFADNPSVLLTYQRYYQYINIDEYQDTNVAQYILTKQISGFHNNITVVGDDYQGIYGFRGSDINNILDFKKDYKNVTEVKLEENYRSTKNIIGAANGLIKNNEKQMHKNLFTNNDEGKRVRVQELETIFYEADYVIQRIEHYLSQGYKESDIAILYRSASATSPFESKLREADIPYQLSGSRSFYQRKEVQDIIYYLRYFLDPNDPVFFERVASTPRRGVSTVTVQKIVDEARNNNKTILDVLKDPSNLKRVNKRALEGIEELRFITEFYTKLAEESTASEIVIDLVQQLDLVNTAYGNEEKERQDERQASLNQLIYEADSKTNQGKSLDEFVETLILDPFEEESKERVQMMTIHASKGLEFPIVFLVNLNEGSFPSHFVDYENKEEIEEERRVAYVALTRAKEELHITYSRMNLTRRGRSLKRRKLSPSIFLYELPDKFITIS